MSIFSMVISVIVAVGLACLAAVDISFFGYWAWNVIQEFMGTFHHSAHS